MTAKKTAKKTQRYRTQASKGVRRRPSLKFTLAPASSRKLDTLSRKTGLPRSRVLDALILSGTADKVLGL